MNRACPLGPEFGGYHHELGAICMRMKADRRTLIQNTSFGHTAQFHLLVPTYEPYVMEQPVIFHESLLPLIITGQRHRSVDLVWFNLRSKPKDLHLQCIGVLGTRTNIIIEVGILGFIGCCVSGMAIGCATAVFPPCAIVAEVAAIPLCSGGAASWLAGAGASIYETVTPDEIYVLEDDYILAAENK